ncbi:hypothetical protein ZOSMA_31G00810 [Zostera marina]|uniref:ZF-HD dimerization-type domain-containing protein n=1 Tax=Zostera marina TaxID=29655 RepID=A0A0K9P8V3_ZOSMR|nr:hypothetical protein ZOSMA_31G00810 [Zostera marina]
MPTSSSPSLHISKSRAKVTPNHKTVELVVDQHHHLLMKIQQDLSYKLIAGDINGSMLVNKVWYRECRKNHAASVGRHAVDGCREFMASGEEGTAGALNCAACSCHRSFHKREVERQVLGDCSSNTASPRS